MDEMMIWYWSNVLIITNARPSFFFQWNCAISVWAACWSVGAGGRIDIFDRLEWQRGDNYTAGYTLLAPTRKLQGRVATIFWSAIPTTFCRVRSKYNPGGGRTCFPRKGRSPRSPCYFQMEGQKVTSGPSSSLCATLASNKLIWIGQERMTVAIITEDDYLIRSLSPSSWLLVG